MFIEYEEAKTYQCPVIELIKQKNLIQTFEVAGIHFQPFSTTSRQSRDGE